MRLGLRRAAVNWAKFSNLHKTDRVSGDFQNQACGRFRWYKANCTEYNRAPLRASLSPLPQYVPADTLAPLPPHRIAVALPPDQRPVGSRWGRFRQGIFITGFIRFAPWHCRPLVRRAQVGLAPGLMRDGAKRMNRLRRAVGFCRPSCNGAALDGFAWLSPWPHVRRLCGAYRSAWRPVGCGTAKARSAPPATLARLVGGLVLRL